MISSHPPIDQLNKLLLTNHDCETVYTKLEGLFGLNGPLCFIPLLLFFMDKNTHLLQIDENHYKTYFLGIPFFW